MHSTGMSEVSRLAHPGFGVSGWTDYGTSTLMAALDADADDLGCIQRQATDGEYARRLSPSSTPGLYLALATDENSDSTLNINTVAADLDASNAIVFIDPGYSGDYNHLDYWNNPLDLFAYYAPLAVNGGAVETEYGSYGYFTFPHLRSILTGRR